MDLFLFSNENWSETRAACLSLFGLSSGEFRSSNCSCSLIAVGTSPNLVGHTQKMGNRSFIGLFVKLILSRKGLRNSKTNLSEIWIFLIIVLFYVVASWARPRMASIVCTMPPPSTTSVVVRRNGATAHYYHTIRSLLSLRLRLRSLLPNSRTRPPLVFLLSDRPLVGLPCLKPKSLVGRATGYLFDM